MRVAYNLTHTSLLVNVATRRRRRITVVTCGAMSNIPAYKDTIQHTVRVVATTEQIECCIITKRFSLQCFNTIFNPYSFAVFLYDPFKYILY